MTTAAENPLGFETFIRPLFREEDRDSMEGWFDLWSYEDVRMNAEAILEKVSTGMMPCDAAWPPEYVARFDAWINSGFPA